MLAAPRRAGRATAARAGGLWRAGAAVMNAYYAASVDALPDLATLRDNDLRKLIRDLQAQEHRSSYKRWLLHGKIDILRAELVARGHGDDSPASGVSGPRRPSAGGAGGQAAVAPDE